jgi:diguanylate cyclase (GGDEF)-like protein
LGLTSELHEGRKSPALKFDEYQDTAANMMLLSAGLFLAMWFWYVVIDPLGANHTFGYRIAMASLLIVTTDLISKPKLARRYKVILLCLCGQLAVATLFAIYLQLKEGFIYGIAGFVYAQISLLICLIRLPVHWAASLHLLAALSPHLFALGAGANNFPHLHYAITVWPCAVLAIGAHVCLERDFAIRQRLRANLQAIAAINPLTGASNRRAFWEAVPLLVSRAARLSCPLAVLVIDIDHFKSVNDTHGHDAGDVVLVAVSACIRHEIRGEELFCRWGGEEFVVLVDESDPHAAQNLAVRIIESLRKLQIPLPNDTQVRITASIGVASTLDGHVRALIKSADSALFAAKAAGRDRAFAASKGQVVSVRSRLPKPLCSREQ